MGLGHVGPHPDGRSPWCVRETLRSAGDQQILCHRTARVTTNLNTITSCDVREECHDGDESSCVFQRRCHTRHRSATRSNEPTSREHHEVVGVKWDEIDATQVNSGDEWLADDPNGDRKELDLLDICQILGLGLDAHVGCENDWRAVARVAAHGGVLITVFFV
jgi:hypothetical protein